MFGPALAEESVGPAFAPKLSVVAGEAVEGEGSDTQSRQLRGVCRGKWELPDDIFVGMAHAC